MNYKDKLEEQFLAAQDTDRAEKMTAYMKNKFQFFGISSPIRKEISKEFLNRSALPEWEEAKDLIVSLWEQPYRELHYFAMELATRYRKDWQKEDLQLFEFMITEQSWWDTVDHISSNLVGPFLQKFPELKESEMQRWNSSGYLWLERASIIFQLKYKDKTDTSLLSRFILAHASSPEFFLRKAIGWALREYSKRDPQWVRKFIEEHELSNLSRKEASKYL